MIEWSQLSENEQLERINYLQNIRDGLVKKSAKRRASKRKRKPKKLSFKSKELEELFYKLPPELQKMLS